MADAPLLSTHAEVLSKQLLGGGYSRIVIRAPEVARRARPGQFAMLRPREGTHPLLNRPFSFYDVDPAEGVLTFLCLELGIGSRLISEYEAGDRVLLIGPLGNVFQKVDGRRPVYVAGGVGVAPFLHAAREFGGGMLLYGGRTREAIVDVDLLEAAGLDVRISTDDGSLGKKGFVTDLLRDLLRKEKDGIALYGCGPNPMIRVLCRMAVAEGVPCQVSIDQKMACGFGTCMGCMVRTAGGYRRVCLDGPVFQAEELAGVDW